MSAITDSKHPELLRSRSRTGGPLIESSVEQAICRRIAACPYNFVFDKVSWEFEEGTLTLRGPVPSFYLKQVLQELLRDIQQIDRIANEVNVVSSNGLSSDRPIVPR